MGSNFNKRFFYILLGIMILLSTTQQGYAQSGAPSNITDDQVNAIAKELYCPVCENVPLDVCGTQACEQWRELIRQKLAEGWSSSQIKQYFVDQYGDRVLATPPAHGFNWLIYVLPPLMILMGAIILYKAIQSWKSPSAQETHEVDAPQANKEDYFERIEEELKKR
ncbi:MAG: cytochrome c-type biogenesis protein [Anaerolineales bacterium]